MSPATASICAVTKSADSVTMSTTPRVLWAVTAVIALVPYTPQRGERLQVGLNAGAALESLPAMSVPFGGRSRRDSRRSAPRPKTSRYWN